MDESTTIRDSDAAIGWLLAAVHEQPTGNRRQDLELAARATLRIRELNSIAGGLVLEALNDRTDGAMSWREIAAMLGGEDRVSVRSLRRWAEPPVPPAEG